VSPRTVLAPTLAGRVAAAPISWGVCEVSGWGVRLPPRRVLAEVRSLGLGAVEAGPQGYLPADPAGLRALLARFDLRLVAGFVALVLHRPDLLDASLAEADRAAALLAAAGAEVLVVAAATGRSGYEGRPAAGEAAWGHLAAALDRLAGLSGRHGLALALHPHAGTVVARRDDVEKLLDSSDVALCVDTGHLLIGGTDPLALVRAVPGRVRHVHLKNVDMAMVRRVAAGDVGYADAVRQGLYRPLGTGDAPVAEVVAELERAGYPHWYVLEQDTALDSEPAEGAGPVLDVRASLEFLGRGAGGPPGRPGPRRPFGHT